MAWPRQDPLLQSKAPSNLIAGSLLHLGVPLHKLQLPSPPENPLLVPAPMFPTLANGTTTSQFLEQTLVTLHSSSTSPVASQLPSPGDSHSAVPSIFFVGVVV